MSLLLTIQIKVKTFTILTEGVMLFLSPSTQLPEQYLKLGHDCFFHIIVYSLFTIALSY